MGAGPRPEGVGLVVQPEALPEPAFPLASSCPSGTMWTALATTC